MKVKYRRQPCKPAMTVVLVSLAFQLLPALQLQSQMQSDDLFGPYLGQVPPGSQPRLFVPEGLRTNADWWWHGPVSFSPDGREFYLDIYRADSGIRLLVMKMAAGEGRWTTPEDPEFAGLYPTACPSFTRNGNKVFFVSDRPGGFIWVSTRISNGWSAPQPVQFSAPPSLGIAWQVSTDDDETLYFPGLDSGSNTDFDIYRIMGTDGRYEEPQRLDDSINSTSMDIGAFIDPRGRYLIFSSDRPGGFGQTDLYVSYRRPDHSWTPAVNMGEPVNSSASESTPFVTVDGRFLFFNSDRDQQLGRNPYWVDGQVVFGHRNPSDFPRHRRSLRRVKPVTGRR